MAKTHESKDG